MIVIPETFINTIKSTVEKAGYSFDYEIMAHDNDKESTTQLNISIIKTETK